LEWWSECGAERSETAFRRKPEGQHRRVLATGILPHFMKEAERVRAGLAIEASSTLAAAHLDLH